MSQTLTPDQPPTPNPQPPTPNRLALSPETELAIPQDAEEAAQILAEAAKKGQGIDIMGGATKQDMGNVFTRLNIVVSTQNLAEVVAYQPEDLTITVQAGMKFDTLLEILAEKGQWLPLDPPRLVGATVGGAMATDGSGPKRLLYGTARDLLIGTQFALTTGVVGKSGGRVVKNVTGYDLHKLMIGSFGTLALLTELTFKVLPKPAATGWGIAAFANLDTTLATARTLARSNLSPVALEIVEGVMGGRGLLPSISGLQISPTNWVLCFAADGATVAVKDQLAGMKALCEQAGAQEVTILMNEASLPLWEGLRQLSEPYNTVLRFGTRPTDLAKAVAVAQKLVAEQGISESALQIRAGTGLVYLYLNLVPEQYLQFAAKIEAYRAELVKFNGYLIVESAIFALRQQLDGWGEMGNAFAPMQAIKQKLDPHGALGPGRFLRF